SGSCTIGRHSSCGLVIADRAASRQHARVFHADGCWQVEDLGSANGTVVNGERLVGRRQLRNGDAIGIGDSEILFACSDAENPPSSAPLDPQSLAGRTIAGFRLERLLARTGTGYVYRAEQRSMQRPAAIKVFARDCRADPSFAERFRAALARAASFTHERFVRVLDSGIEGGLAWYATEWIDGDTLEQLLQRERRFAPALGLLIIERVAAALADAHRAGLVHGALELRSVMLDQAGKIRIFDLGLAELLPPGRVRPEHLWYRAPDSTTPPEAPEDAYAVGCMLYHVLTGAPPFTGATAEAVQQAHAGPALPSLRSVLPRPLAEDADALLAQLLAKRRAQRSSDLAEAAARLRALRQKLADAAAAEQQAQRLAARAAAARRAREQHLLKQVLVGAAAVLVVGILGFVVLPQLLRSAPVGTADAAATSAPASAGTHATPATPTSVPAVSAAAPPPAPPAAAAPASASSSIASDPALSELQALRRRIPEGASIGWPTLEDELASLQKRLAQRPQLANELQLAREQLQRAAAAWYREQLAALPPPKPEHVGARLSTFLRLRDVAGSDERLDADNRYQQELILLMQHLNDTRRQARRALEAGRFEELLPLAESLAAATVGTPFAALQRQFAAQCREAAGIKAFWQRDWKTTALTFEQQRGERALAAGAALLLAGEHARARRLLLGDPALNRGELQLRRADILSGLSAVLDFNDPADLFFLEVERGEPRMAESALVGSGSDSTALLCTVPIGGPDWLCEATLHLAGEDAEALISCVSESRSHLLLRISDDQLTLRQEQQEQRLPLPTAGTHRLRLGARGGALVISLAGREVLRLPRSPVPPDARLRLEFSGADWRLEALQVAGGR
ncbi:MAG: FHA domain-containing protein kinase, partial [Planctomycetes bacterium]|nr:FHA domain-containing protein kinase [Planctomycetota bacterium]